VIGQESAQQVLSKARQLLPSRLVGVGLVKRGSVLEFPDPADWILVGMQSSRASTPIRRSVTVNGMVVSKAAWQEKRDAGEKYPEVPDPNVGYGVLARPVRIGIVMPGGQDYWWDVTPDSDPEDIAGRLALAIEDYLLPTLLERRTTSPPSATL
jgi:hypothetical protein